MSRKLTKGTELPYQSKAAKRRFSAEEAKLPKPNLAWDVAQLKPSDILRDTLRYTRSAESRGEYLYRTEYLIPLIKSLIQGREEDSLWEDVMGNIVVHVGAEPWDVLHVGHMDTIHEDDAAPYQDIIEKDDVITLAPIVKNSVPVIATGVRWINDIRHTHHYTDYDLPKVGRRSLGADDGCAIAVMVYLIANGSQGTYVFTRAEEVGCIGISFMMENGSLDFSSFKMAIEVDRKGQDEIIGNMSVGLTASTAFTDSFVEQLDMPLKRGRGTITDVGYLASLIPECINLSAGYLKQHTDKESTCPSYLDKLGEALLKVDYEALVITRKAGQSSEVASSQPASIRGYQSTYSGSSRGYYTYPKTNTNSFGDWTGEPTSDDGLADTHVTMYELNSFVRSNNGLISEFLMALNISPARMAEIARMGEISDEPEENEDFLSDEEEDILINIEGVSSDDIKEII